MKAQKLQKILISHPSPDLYGSDLQLLETIEALNSAGYIVNVVLPASGPLENLIEKRGGRVQLMNFPVSRKSVLSPIRLPNYLIMTLISLYKISRLIRTTKPSVVYANTLTVPVWMLAAKLCRVPLICHVHEAEETVSKTISLLLSLPLLLSNAIIVNSKASRRVLELTVPKLSSRIVLIYNGIPHSGHKPSAAVKCADGRTRVTLVGRLSPRKGTDVALEAVAELVRNGNDVSLTICGNIYPGYEWFASELESRAHEPDLSGRIDFAGYVTDVAAQLARSEIVIVPSLAEPFGNVAVEAQFANRPIIASNVQGLAEIITHDSTGILVEPGDASQLAAAIAKIIADPQPSIIMANAAYASANKRFTVERYQSEIVKLVAQAAGRQTTGFGDIDD